MRMSKSSAFHIENMSLFHSLIVSFSFHNPLFHHLLTLFLFTSASTVHCCYHTLHYSIPSSKYNIMRIGTTVLATIVGLSSIIGFANADRNLQGTNNWRSLNPVIEFSDLVIRWVRESERGPTISGHFMVHVNVALFNAWAAFEDGTTGVRVGK